MSSTTTMERRIDRIKSLIIATNDPNTRRQLVQELSTLSNSVSDSSYRMGYENGYSDAHRFVPSGL